MGRPIKNKYINPYGANYTAGDGAQRPGYGGEAVTVTSGNASPTFSNRGLGYFVANATAFSVSMGEGYCPSRYLRNSWNFFYLSIVVPNFHLPRGNGQSSDTCRPYLQTRSFPSIAAASL